MKAYVDLSKVLPVNLYILIMDLRYNSKSTSKERAKRLDRSVQILVTQFQKLQMMGLVRKIGHGRYMNILDSKVNDI